MSSHEQFAALISEVARGVVRRRASDACCGDLSLEQFETLQAVSRAEPSSIGALAASLAVEVSTMSRNASVLERNGYLVRAKSPDDGRVVVVTLTAKGRSALSTLRCGERDVLGDLYDRVPAAQRASLMLALETLRGCLTEPGPATECCPPVPLRRGGS